MRIGISEITRLRIIKDFECLRKDPTKIQQVYNRLDKHIQNKSMHPIYIKRWQELLNLSNDKIEQLLLQDNEEGNLLRSISIFSNINKEPLNEDDRRCREEYIIANRI